MAKITNGLLEENNRVFFPSTNINIFPCSRRGQYTEELNEKRKITPKYYDPEARLNTERTNRLHTAINGFKDDFIVSYTANKLIFVLKGYYIEIKDFRPSDIAEALGIGVSQIYAHLSLHSGISLNVEDYYTEILYRQSTEKADLLYLDVAYTAPDEEEKPVTKDFFVGVSFTANESAKETVTDGVGEAIPYFLPLFSLFSYSDTKVWQLVQTSLLPKIEHGEEEDLVKIPGDLLVDRNLTVKNEATFNTINVTNKIVVPHVDATTDITTTDLTAKTINADKITQNDKAVPAIKLTTQNNPTRYRLEIELDASQNY